MAADRRPDRENLPIGCEVELIPMQQGQLKQMAVRGAVHNLLFSGAGSVLTYLQALFVMRLLGPDQIGIYAMAAVVGISVDFISDFGIGDRLVQQDSENLRNYYDCAATLHLIAAVGLCGLVILSAPLLAHIYRQPALRLLISVMSYSAFGGFLRLPLSLLYRDLNFFQQRLWIFLGRVAGFVVTIGLALAGEGIWSLVIGSLATLLVTGVPAWVLSRFRPRWRLDLAEVKSLVGFSSPVWFSKLAYLTVQQGCIVVLSLSLSTQDVGQYKSAEQLASIVFYLEVVVGQTIFPVLCRLKNDPVRLGKAFNIANRITVAWVAAFSIALYLFAGDVVRVVLTPKWAGAELFLRAQGVALLFGAVFFSWDAILKAKDLTRPIFHLSALFAGAFLIVFVPLALYGGRQGAATGLITMSLLILLGRCYFLLRLKSGISIWDIVKRPLVSSAAAAAAVIAARAWVSTAFPLGLAAYGIVYLAAILWLERSLAKEAIKLLRHDHEIATSAVVEHDRRTDESPAYARNVST